MNLSILPEEEKLLVRRLSDLAYISAERNIPRFSNFLNERQQLVACAFLEQNHIENASLFGGYGEAVRRMCGFFPVNYCPSIFDFPHKAVTLRYRGDSSLSHRDFLGALMALGITRESVGDLIVLEGQSIIFLSEGIYPFVLRELKKVGNTGVACMEGFDESIVVPPQFKEMRGTVSSPRMDSLVKLITSFSREKSAGLIVSGIVQRNYSVTLSVSDSFKAGDTITIRGFGKYIIDDIGNSTKKGRLPVSIRQYI